MCGNTWTQVQAALGRVLVQSSFHPTDNEELLEVFKHDTQHDQKAF